MSSNNDLGRAFEFACITTLEREISSIRTCSIQRDAAFHVITDSWNYVGTGIQNVLLESAKSIVETIFNLEPRIIEQTDDVLILKSQPDSKGEVGDVRDILISRDRLRWEIGLSVKHNHFAVKHSRLATKLDFGEKWFGVPCSANYWNDVRPIFNRLEGLKNKGLLWKDIAETTHDEVYVPILKAFVNEIRRQVEVHSEIPKKMVQYLLGNFDFYKIVSVDNMRLTHIQTFNLNGTLNKSSATKKPKNTIPIVNLPTKLIAIDFKEGSKTTVEMYLNNGWQFSFRIHSAEGKIVPSLKFDIQIVGIPSTIISINCFWN